MSNYRIRPCNAGDAAAIARHRVAMFQEMGEVPDPTAAAELLAASMRAIRTEVEHDAYVGWLAVTADDDVIAGVGAHVKPNLPRMSPDRSFVASSPVPLVVNMYTEPPWRKQGIARALMRTLMHWAGTQGFDRVLLHASDQGRALYASLGFIPTNEMRWSPKSGVPTP